MPKFIVKHTAILHDGKRYDVGSEIELTAEQAENNALNLQAVVTKTTAPATITEEDVVAAEANIANAEAEKVAEAEKATKAKPAKEKEK